MAASFAALAAFIFSASATSLILSLLADAVSF